MHARHDILTHILTRESWVKVFLYSLDLLRMGVVAISSVNIFEGQFLKRNFSFEISHVIMNSLCKKDRE